MNESLKDRLDSVFKETSYNDSNLVPASLLEVFIMPFGREETDNSRIYTYQSMLDNYKDCRDYDKYQSFLNDIKENGYKGTRMYCENDNLIMTQTIK